MAGFEGGWLDRKWVLVVTFNSPASVNRQLSRKS